MGNFLLDSKGSYFGAQADLFLPGLVMIHINVMTVLKFQGESGEIPLAFKI